MTLSVTKSVPSYSDKLEFLSEIIGTKCESAKKLAIDNNQVFELQVPTNPEEVAVKEIPLDFLFEVLKPDQAIRQWILDLYSVQDISQNNASLKISHFSITCDGRVNISVTAPEIDSGLRLFSNGDNLKIGLGLAFQSGISFSAADMVCIIEN